MRTAAVMSGCQAHMGRGHSRGHSDSARCSESVATNQHEAIQAFIQGTVADGAPVVPISAQLKYNVDAVCEYIVKKIPVWPRPHLSSALVLKPP